MAQSNNGTADTIVTPEQLAVNNRRTKLPVMVELGRTGLRRWQDDRAYVQEEFLPQLQGQKAIQTYREMAYTDPVVGAGLHVIDTFMRKVPWRVEPADDTDKARAYADFVEQMIDDLEDSWPDTVSEIMSMIIYGWSVHEILYKVRSGDNKDSRYTSRFDDGLLAWAGFPIRAQDTLNGWVYDANTRRLVGMRQLAPPDYADVIVPMEKALLFRTQVRKANPEGLSILRRAFRPYFFKSRIEEIQGVGIERDLAGLPVAYVPADLLSTNASPKQQHLRQVIENMVRNVRRDKQEGIVFPQEFDAQNNSMYRFELLSTGGARQFNTVEVLQQYDSRIAMTMLADFLLLGQSSVGSWALSSDKVNLFTEALRAWATSVAAQFNRFAIPRLFRLNGFPTDQLPQLVPGEIAAPPLPEIGQYVTSLSSAGFPLWPNRELEDHLLEVARLPTPNESERQEREHEEAMRQEQSMGQFMAPDEEPGAPAQPGSPAGAAARQAAPQGSPRTFGPARPRQLAGAAAQAAQAAGKPPVTNKAAEPMIKVRVPRSLRDKLTT